MDINHRNMSLFFKALSKNFRVGLDVQLPIDLGVICEDLPLSTEETDFSWLGEAEDLRLWENGRELTELAAYKYSITNQEWERTLRVKIRDIENDITGLYGNRAEKLGRVASRWKMFRVLDLLKKGESTVCLDGQNFFDTDHPSSAEGTTTPNTYANYVSGGAQAASPFYLFDTSHVLKPLIFQSEAPVFESQTDPNSSESVFMRREALYGVRVYGGGGYSFPQYAFKSTNAFSTSEFKTRRAAMESFCNYKGQIVGSSPNLLVYGRGQRDVVEDILFQSNVATTDGSGPGAAMVLRKPTVFSGLSSLYCSFLP